MVFSCVLCALHGINTIVSCLFTDTLLGQFLAHVNLLPTLRSFFFFVDGGGGGVGGR